MQWLSENSSLVFGILFMVFFLFKGKIMGLIFKINTISGNELKSKLNESKLTLIDVRSQAEFETNHIPQALNIPLQQFTKERIANLKLNSDQPVYLICASGNRSLMAAINMRKLGVGQATNVSGGMLFYKGL